MATGSTNETDRRDLAQIAALTAAPGTKDARVKTVMQYLHDHRRDYHWVGVYVLHGQELVLDPYVGPETDHVRIPVGRGVCGTAVAENKNQVIGDVSKLSNYLACNLDTKSEIVVLIRDARDQRILGQIDVDGRRLNQFDAAEESFLAAVADMLAPLYGGARP